MSNVSYLSFRNLIYQKIDLKSTYSIKIYNELLHSNCQESNTNFIKKFETVNYQNYT